MAEYVTQYEGPGDADLSRVRAFVGRLGDESAGLLRTRDRRDAEVLFEWVTAAKGRMPIERTRFHVCRHDEGVGDCSAAVVEG